MGTRFAGSKSSSADALKKDDGVAALVIVAVIAIVAFTALTIFLGAFNGSRELTHTQGAAGGERKIAQAIYAYYLSTQGAAAHQLPCPDAEQTPAGHQNPTGGATSTTCATGNYIGVVPWADLGLSQQDVIDPYGNYYTYIVSGSTDGLCQSVTSSYATTATQYTGALVSMQAPALEVLQAPQASGQGLGRIVPFAIISHGADKTGALSNAGILTQTPAANSYEAVNETSVNNNNPPTYIYTGPTLLSSGTSIKTYFDDQVFVPATADLQKICAQITPGGAINASISDNFASTTASATNFANIGANGVTVSAPSSNASSPTPDAHFAGITTGVLSYLATSTTNFYFAPLTRPVYVSATWIADTTPLGYGGMSIATRATPADLTAGSDTFATTGTAGGITFRFYDATKEGAADNIGTTATDCTTHGTSAACNAISIYYNGTTNTTAVATSSGKINLVSGEVYTLEAYDDGSNVWMRITQNDTPTNTAYAYATGVTGDTTGSQQVLFINGTSPSEVNYVLVGFPMLALETSGNSAANAVSYASSTGNGIGAAGVVTLEAWVRPRSLTSGDGTIVGKWDTAKGQSYRLRMNSSGQAIFDVAVQSTPTATTACTTPATDLCESFAGPSLTVDQWTHIAVTYSFVGETETVDFYENGDPYSTFSNTLQSGNGGVSDAATTNFGVGADFNNGTAIDGFNGDISDVRVWNVARTASEINQYYQTRLSAVAADEAAGGSINGLVVNWRLDTESTSVGGLAATTAATTPLTLGTAGTLTTALYSPTIAQYFRPISTSMCPTGTIANAYECDFRVASHPTIAVPDNLLGVYAMLWGAGGGAFADTNNTNYVSNGGGGGFTAGLMFGTTAATVISGSSYDIIVGGQGTGTSAGGNQAGGGGGGGSVIRVDGCATTPATCTVLLAAGGGGGASYANIIATGSGGAGGGGGGAGALTSRAPDTTGLCGGEGGDQSGSFGVNPPNAICLSGGNFTSAPQGGAGAGGGAGGSSSGTTVVDATGGAGALGTALTGGIGAGGGGGGISNQGATLGGGEEGGYADLVVTYSFGFGGGGGSGFAAATGIVNSSGFAGTSTGTAVPSTSFFYASPGNYTITTYTPGIGGSPTAASPNGSDGTIVLIW